MSRKSPECKTIAQYIHNYSIKDIKGKNHRFPEEIFGLVLIFGRNKTEIFGKIEGRSDRKSERPRWGFIDRGKSKKQAKNMPKYVIIFIQYANKSKFFYSDEGALPLSTPRGG